MAEFRSDRLYRAGDVIVDDVTVVSYSGFRLDLRKMVSDFSIYEDIYSNFLSGSLVFSDSMNLVKNTPIVGDEDLFITFYTPGVDDIPRKVRFKIFKISTYVRGAAPNAIAVRLEFVSHIAEISIRTKLNRVMKNLTFSEMASDIHNSMRSETSGVTPKVKPLLAENTFGKSTVIIPNWSPLYAINWFTHRSIAPQNKSISDYLYYETLDGFNFRSLSSLKTTDPVCTYKSAPGGFRSISGDRMIESELRNITSYSVRDLGDKIKETSMGVYASNMLVHEMTTKSYYSNPYSYRSEFNNTPHLNKGRMVVYDNPIQDNILSHTKYYSKNFFQFNDLQDTNYIDSSQSRQSLLNRMNAMTLVIDVYGDSTIRVGNVINVEFFSQEYTKGKSDFLDSYLSGKYMVTTILHNIVSGVHTMRMTIARDSYYEQLPDKKLQDLK